MLILWWIYKFFILSLQPGAVSLRSTSHRRNSWAWHWRPRNPLRRRWPFPASTRVWWMSWCDLHTRMRWPRSRVSPSSYSRLRIRYNPFRFIFQFKIPLNFQASIYYQIFINFFKNPFYSKKKKYQVPKRFNVNIQYSSLKNNTK